MAKCDRLRVTRQVMIPDEIRLNRYQRLPELGPALLFLSGGSALNSLVRVLKHYTHNSIHLVTPFDSGGSSAKLRAAFAMPSIGDLRSRLIALADESVTGQPAVCRLFAHRLSTKAPVELLQQQLKALVAGEHKLMRAVENPLRRLIRHQLGFFYEVMPEEFNLQGASIGNLILTGGYLNNHRHLDPIIFLFSQLVGVKGVVRAVVSDDLQLRAELADGTVVVGQHRLTGKEVAPLTVPIERLSLCRAEEPALPVSVTLGRRNRELIGRADLIAYPPGSFYSSVIANLLPQGVGSAIAANCAPKVYIPNLGADPEQLGLSLDGAVERLLDYLSQSAETPVESQQLLNFILLDSRRGRYRSPLTVERWRAVGIEVIDTPLISRNSAPYYDPELLTQVLLSLV